MNNQSVDISIFEPLILNDYYCTLLSLLKITNGLETKFIRQHKTGKLFVRSNMDVEDLSSEDFIPAPDMKELMNLLPTHIKHRDGNNDYIRHITYSEDTEHGIDCMIFYERSLPHPQKQELIPDTLYLEYGSDELEALAKMAIVLFKDKDITLNTLKNN